MPSALDCMAMYIARYLIYTFTVHNKIHEAKKGGIRTARLSTGHYSQIMGLRVGPKIKMQCEIVEKISHGARNPGRLTTLRCLTCRYDKKPFYLACHF